MKTLRPRTRLTLLLLAAGLVALTALARDRVGRVLAGSGTGSEEDYELDVVPAGFWHPVRPAGAGEPSGGPAVGQSPAAAERARLLSLPYLGGRAPAAGAGPRGVVAHDPERAVAGLNLYTSGHGPEAVLMDMEGRTLHRWRRPFEAAFPGVAPTADTAFFRRAHLFPDGRLLVLYQTGGLAFLDRDSRLLGRCRGNFYNDVWVGDDGRIWTLGKEVRAAGAGPERLDDFLVLLRHRGDGEACREVRRLSIAEAFERSGLAHLLEPMAAAGDVFHSNTVSELDGSLEERSPIFARCNLLVSLREVDVVAVVEPRSGRVVWARRGPWRGQHEPSLLPTGRILLFDNRGLEGHSRLVEVDPLTGEIGWTWAGAPADSFSSPIGGACARLPGGNTLVTESVPGRAFELDPEGRIVWEFRTPHRAGRDSALVAMLFELVRLPLDSLRAGPG